MTEMQRTRITTRDQIPAPPPVLDSPTIAELAAEQGVKPIEDIDELVGDFWPEEESADEFLATLRAWRDGLNP
jgi:hypothetical protein